MSLEKETLSKSYWRCILFWIYYIEILVNIINVVCITYLVFKVLSIWSIFHWVLSLPVDHPTANCSDSRVGAGGLSSPTSLQEALQTSLPQW